MFVTASISFIVGIMFLLTVEERPNKEIFDLAYAENVTAEPMMVRPSTWKQVKRGIPFLDAWMIQGVLICSLGYIGVKILNYGLIMWLPYYVEVGLHGSGRDKGALAGLFDIGGIIGSAAAGWASDKIGQRCLVVLICTGISIPLLVMFESLTEDTIWVAYFIVPASGFVIWGASNLICSAISADLAQGAGLARQEALSTVAGIVNGTGSIGAAVGQFAVRFTQIGYLQGYGWGHVFYFLLAMAGFSMSLLGVLTYQEIARKRIERNEEKLKA
jgi:OPA family glycerol-3-phosphate transporter-like MFS transporter 3